MAAIPGWTVGSSAVSTTDNTVTFILVPESTVTDQVGTDFPFGCRWCGRSTRQDGVEICEQLNGVVHSDCHQDECGDTRCAYLLCTDERCDYRDECEDCGDTVCLRHGPAICCE